MDSVPKTKDFTLSTPGVFQHLNGPLPLGSVSVGELEMYTSSYMSPCKRNADN